MDTLQKYLNLAAMTMRFAVSTALDGGKTLFNNPVKTAYQEYYKFYNNLFSKKFPAVKVIRINHQTGS